MGVTSDRGPMVVYRDGMNWFEKDWHDELKRREEKARKAGRTYNADNNPNLRR